MKRNSTLNHSIPLGVRLFGLLLLVGVAAFFLAGVWTNSLFVEKNPLVIGRSVVTTPALSAPITPSIPPSAPLSGPTEWTITLPAGYKLSQPDFGGGAGGISFGNNNQFAALLRYTNPGNPVWYMDVYRASDGALLQSALIPANTMTVYLETAREADVISVVYLVKTASNCSTTTNPSTLYVSKYTSTGHVFTDTFPPACPSGVRIKISPQGKILAGYTVPGINFRKYNLSNTNGSPDIQISNSGGLDSYGMVHPVSGDLHYTLYSWNTSFDVVDLDIAPGTQIFNSLIPPIPRGKLATNLDGSRHFECKADTGDTKTRVTMFRPSPPESPQTYTWTIIDEIPGFHECDIIKVTDDGSTLYVQYNDPGTYSYTYLNIYRSENGDLYKRTSIVVPTYYFSTSIAADGSRGLGIFSPNSSTFGHGGPVQVFAPGSVDSIFQFDFTGEESMNAALSSDGSRVLLGSCVPSVSSCTTTRVRMIDLSLIPVGVRGTYYSSGSPRVELRWDPVPGALSYTVLRASVDDVRLAQNMGTGIADTHWIDYQAVPGQTYYYFVKARDTITHHPSDSVRVATQTLPASLSPCPVIGSVLNGNGSCTIRVPVSVSGIGRVEVLGASTWSEVQGALSGTSVVLNDVKNRAYSSSSSIGSTTYSGGRLFMHAAMPVLPSTISIQLAALSIAPGLHSSSSTGSANTYDVVASTQANPNVLSTSDYSRVNLNPAQVYASLPTSSFSYFTQSTFPFTSAGLSALQDASGKTFKFAIVQGYHLNGNTYPPATSGSEKTNKAEFLLPYAYYFDYPGAAPATINITYTV